MAVTARVVFDHLPRFRASLRAGCERAVAQAAQAVAEGARARSRVDTGAMAAGWTAEVNGQRARVSNPVDHTIYNEYGTYKMAAQPMLAPAVEEAQPGFEAAVQDALPR